jgi:hypothetical protein
MRVVLFGCGLFLATFLTHLVLWRIRVPRRAFRALLLLFLGALPAAYLLTAVLPALAAVTPSSPWQWLHVALFHVPVSLGYIVTYSALEEDSPTLIILVFLEDAGAAGRSREDLYGLIGNDFVIGSRLEALLTSGLLTSVEGKYQLAAKGRSWARLFGAFRWLYCLNPGG